jgi:glucose-1-phosphate thymidylyltransferase
MRTGNKKLKARLLNEGYSWFDTGTFDSLLDAANMVRTIENNRDSIICSPELVGYQNGWITKEKLSDQAKEMIKNKFGQKIEKYLKGKEN